MSAVAELTLDAKIIGKRILAHRTAMGISQAKLAELTNYVCAQTSIGGWERGVNVPDAIAISVLATVFECTTDELIAEEE